MFELILTIVSCLLIFVGFGFVAHVQIRNPQVSAFIIRIADLCHDWSLNHIREIAMGQEISAFEWFFKDKVPTYNKLLFSFRPLTLDEWFEKDDLKKLFEE